MLGYEPNTNTVRASQYLGEDGKSSILLHNNLQPITSADNIYGKSRKYAAFMAFMQTYRASNILTTR